MDCQQDIVHRLDLAVMQTADEEELVLHHHPRREVSLIQHIAQRAFQHKTDQELIVRIQVRDDLPLAQPVTAELAETGQCQRVMVYILQ